MIKDEHKIIKDRIIKLEKIREMGVNPYPYRYAVSHKTSDIRKSYNELKNGESIEDRVSVAGRIRLVRGMGKVNFMDLEDLSGRIQLYLEKGNLGDKYEVLKLLDIGDFLGAEGNVFKTRRGELSINVDNYEILSKAIRPLPDKYYGLKDPEFRYRQRGIDLIMNPNVKETFIKRTKAIEAMREFLNKQGFLEVETPLLQSVYGGASARPFITKIHALNMPVYLSISPELYLKRLIVGGMEKVYTICKNFRNEGIDITHNPEFTMMECYWAYSDYNDMMKLTEDMYAYIFNKVLGTTKVKYRNIELDFTPPWKRITMYDAVEQYTGISPVNLTKEQLAEEIIKRGYNKKITVIGKDTKGSLVQELFKLYCEENLIQPTFIIDHPKESTPLCKVHRKNPELIERFEPFVYRMEIGNAYSELNDPIIQRTLLEEQERFKEEGDEEAHPMDKEFLRAIEYGMPVTGGLGLGIDRMVMFLTNSKSIRDVIYFPFMKPSK